MNLEIAYWRGGERHRQNRCSEPEFALCSDHDHPSSSANTLPSLLVRASSESGKITIENRGPKVALPWHHRALEPNDTLTLPLPVMVSCDQTYWELRDASQRVTDRPLLEIPNSRADTTTPLVPPELLGRSPSAVTLARWFEALGLLQRAAATSQDFLDRAAAAVTEPGGLDAGLIVLNERGGFRIAASCLGDPALGIAYCPDLVQRVLDEKRTYFHNADGSGPDHGQYDSVVASPIVDENDEAIGVVYGIRSLRGENLRCSIRPLEALWVQLIADAISGGLQRAASEARAARTRVLFEQAFSPKLVGEILRDPQILESRERELTVLFCDVRDSTKIGEHLGPQPTYELLSDILEFFTQHVTQHEGVIIDYYGDGLAAMWNAPHPQRSHAEQACRTGIAMAASIHQLNQVWRDRLPAPLRIGVGIHSGIAQVGNAGTSTRLKYGPRGQMLTVANRLESATKRLATPLLISGATFRQLPAGTAARPLGNVALYGLRDPVEVYELHSLQPDEPLSSIHESTDVFLQVLECMRQGKLGEAEKLANQHLAQNYDGPVEFLLRELENGFDPQVDWLECVDLS